MAGLCLHRSQTTMKGNKMTIYTTLRSSVAAPCCSAAPYSACATVANADAIDDITKAGVLNVGVFADFPPFSSASADMTPQGL